MSKRIAGFELLEVVGRGNMGVVHRARQTAMDRIVAVKLLDPQLSKDPVFRERFIQEARVSAKLNHLNIISGIDCGEEDGQVYFAMDFVEGRTVRQLLAGGPLDCRESVRIVRQMAEALCYAQERGLVHRDVKPDNILVTKEGVAKLCDLGLAKVARVLDTPSSKPASQNPNITQSGATVGTPHFIAPEQAQGGKVDTRSDIYSLGATFFMMLTGRTLFLAKQSRDVMAKHLTDEAPGACDLNPDVPEAYGQILHRMLAKDPADRYQRAADLAADLDAVLAGRPSFHAAGFRGRSSCAPPPAPKPATKSSRRIVQPSARILLPSEIAQRQAERRLARKRRNWILIGSFAGFAVVVFLFLLPRLSCSPTPPAPPTRTPFREPPQSAPPPSAPVPPAPPLEPPPVETRKNGL